MFQVVATRYESGSIVLTTNRVFRDWGQIFDVDNTLATATTDRLMRHGEAFLIRGDSYRMEDKNEGAEQFRLLRQASVPDAAPTKAPVVRQVGSEPSLPSDDRSSGAAGRWMVRFTPHPRSLARVLRHVHALMNIRPHGQQRVA